MNICPICDKEVKNLKEHLKEEYEKSDKSLSYADFIRKAYKAVGPFHKFELIREFDNGSR